MDYKSNKESLRGAQVIAVLIYIMLADMYLFPLLTFLPVIFSFMFPVGGDFKDTRWFLLYSEGPSGSSSIPAHVAIMGSVLCR